MQLSGRSKEIINRDGKKFFPREVEEILYTHPAILHAAMVGMPDARLGERNCLCIIPKPGRNMSLADAVTFLRGQIAEYKLPETIERFEEFSMTGTGAQNCGSKHNRARKLQCLFLKSSTAACNGATNRNHR